MTERSGGLSKSWREADPFRQREAHKYGDPIPSREYISEFLHQYGAPLTETELAAEWGLHADAAQIALRRRLNAMVHDGQLVRNRRDGYCLVNRKELIRGRVIAHRDGFGFLQPDDGSNDLFLTPVQMRSVLHGDVVVVQVVRVDRQGRREAALVEVLERNTEQVVGRFYHESGVSFVTPSNRRVHQDILVPEHERAGAAHGQFVVAQLVQQPSRWKQPIGRIVEVLGEHMAPGMEIDVAIRTHGLPVQWPQAVTAEVARLDADVPESAKLGRLDLRHLPLVTIDGIDARDFDDAVYCEAKPKGWRLLVAIADVSSYVRPGSALDAEARLRGASVYFPDRVIPMLPEKLSNGLCSLNPDVDRLCMVCELHVNRTGRVTRSRFREAVMRSRARLTYDEVAAVLVDKDAELRRRFSALAPHLEDLYALFKVLRGSREERGAIDFDTGEIRILLGEGRKVERIVSLQRNDAHKIIEECMVLANTAAANFLRRWKMPSLYRAHAGPTAEKLEDLRSFLGELGLSLGGGVKPEPSHYAALLAQVRSRADAHLVETVLLRSLAQAVYSPDNNGHFGLALDAYTHFTSPIRRYPDLLAHRALGHAIAGQTAASFGYSHTDLVSLGEQCSATERRADEATRDAIDWLKCEYMMDKVGEEFDGLITGVASFGVFVELDAIYVEGMVHVTTLRKDYYHFDPIGHRLIGERSGRVYRLADRLRLRVLRVDLDERKIDFSLAEEPESAPRMRRGKGIRRHRMRGQP